MSFLLKPTHFHQEYKAENDEVLPIRTDGGSPSTSVGGRISCELHNCLKTYLVKPSEFFELGEKPHSEPSKVKTSKKATTKAKGAGTDRPETDQDRWTIVRSPHQHELILQYPPRETRG
ncbi:hypothetical protein J6590_104963 [Homalodisca vitripennis]|nr:hypothetical protein J6590_104963 [Homalodisca vitripennis]